MGSAIPVLIDSAGQLGTTSLFASVQKGDSTDGQGQRSDPGTQASNVPLQERRPDGTPQFGLIAEEVEKVNPDLVVRDENGEIYTVRYDAVNAMLLNEFLKEHRKSEEQEQDMQELKATDRSSQQKQIDALTANLKK